jgi:hypothetical protein
MLQSCWKWKNPSPRGIVGEDTSAFSSQPQEPTTLQPPYRTRSRCKFCGYHFGFVPSTVRYWSGWLENAENFGETSWVMEQALIGKNPGCEGCTVCALFTASRHKHTDLLTYLLSSDGELCEHGGNRWQCDFTSRSGSRHPHSNNKVRRALATFLLLSLKRCWRWHSDRAALAT